MGCRETPLPSRECRFGPFRRSRHQETQNRRRDHLTSTALRQAGCPSARSPTQAWCCGCWLRTSCSSEMPQIISSVSPTLVGQTNPETGIDAVRIWEQADPRDRGCGQRATALAVICCAHAGRRTAVMCCAQTTVWGQRVKLGAAKPSWRQPPPPAHNAQPAMDACDARRWAAQSQYGSLVAGLARRCACTLQPGLSHEPWGTGLPCAHALEQIRQLEQYARDGDTEIRCTGDIPLDGDAVGRVWKRFGRFTDTSAASFGTGISGRHRQSLVARAARARSLHIPLRDIPESPA